MNFYASEDMFKKEKRRENALKSIDDIFRVVEAMNKLKKLTPQEQKTKEFINANIGRLKATRKVMVELNQFMEELYEIGGKK